ncbi:hypothetical protein MCECIE61_00636 [Candidatus Methylopumilus planktonicus]
MDLEKKSLNIFQKISYGLLPLYVLYWVFAVTVGLVEQLVANFIDTDNEALTFFFYLHLLFIIYGLISEFGEPLINIKNLSY